MGQVTKRVAGAGPTPAMPSDAARVRKALRDHADPLRAQGAARFFKTGKGGYGEGDMFIGVTVPQQRAIARGHRLLALEHIDRLLRSRIHEERLTALLILVDQFNRSQDERSRQRIFDLYMKRLPFINNWDLVDSSAEHIVGGWLAGRQRDRLDTLARSENLWARRVAMIATFHYIKRGEAADAVRIAAALLDDSHDLIHKAVGWMLREVGKRADAGALTAFLTSHAGRMPRTALRYAIERLPAAERARWMAVPRQVAVTGTSARRTRPAAGGRG
jgi:3-methyladenine DNA glycosylase AlkD